MSKVLVDRELLERIASDDEGVASSADFEDLKRVLSQPAEAEGVEVVAWRHFGDRTRLLSDIGKQRAVPGGTVDEFTVPLMTVTQHLAALSAVTAERDRLRASRLYWVAPAGSGLVRCVTDERYRKFSPSIRAKYDPVCCVDTAMAAKEE